LVIMSQVAVFFVNLLINIDYHISSYTNSYEKPRFDPYTLE